MSTWHGVMADGEEFMRWKISTNTVYGYKTDTKCAHSVRGRPTLKDRSAFGTGWSANLTRDLFESEHLCCKRESRFRVVKFVVM